MTLPLPAPELRPAELAEETLPLDLLGLTRRSYPWPKWALLAEVPSQPGFYAPRRIDAMALGMWASTHHRLVAFEFKASRSDWLRELKQPEKCRAALQLADEFFLVSATGIAKREEIPAGWGWLEVEAGNRRLRKRVHPQRKAPAAHCGRGLAALLVRRASEALEKIRIAERRRIEREERAILRAEIEAQLDGELQRLRAWREMDVKGQDAVWRALGIVPGVLAERGEAHQVAIREALVAAGLVPAPYRGGLPHPELRGKGHE